MRKIVLIAILFSAPLFGQNVPTPQINLSGNIGCIGFPCLNSGTYQMPSDANVTFAGSNVNTSAISLKVTSAVSLTATRTITYPAGRFFINVENATTGGQSIQIIGPSGTGVTVPNGQTVSVWNDGVNYVQVGTSSGGGGETPFGGYTSGQPNIPCATSISTSLPCTSAQFEAAGNIVSNPVGGQGITLPGGTGLTLTETNTTESSPALMNLFINCVGPGFDYGNGPTSAQGWANCKGSNEYFLMGNSGIGQVHSIVSTHSGTGDFAGMEYVYSTCYGGFVEASGEQCTPLVIHADQAGYYTGTVSNGGGGAVGSGGNIASGTIAIASQSKVLYSGTIQTISFAITGNGGAVDGQPLYFVVEHPTGGTNYTTTAVQQISVPATSTAPQTVSVSLPALAGDYVGVYVPPGYTGLTEGNPGPILAVSGAPTIGFNGTFGTTPNGVTIAFSLSPLAPGATTILVNNFTCQQCTQDPRAGDLFADGGILLDTQTSSTNTITANGIQMGGAYYTIGSGATIPTSYAWGNLVASSCTPNPTPWKTYTSQTCQVIMGTAPASPNAAFEAGSVHACLVGPWYEEVQITAVGTAGGNPTITFNSFQSWDGVAQSSPTLVMQGGPCGRALVPTATVSYWPVAYQEVGYDGSNLYIADCFGGSCAVRVSDPLEFTVGESITSYPMAMIVGTIGGVSGGAQLATNSIPFAVGDSIVGAPSSSYYSTGINIYTSQHNGGSNGIRVVDSGAVGLTAAYTAININQYSPYAYYSSGNYGSELFVNTRPIVGVCGIICVQGNVIDGTHSYSIFFDGANGGATGQGGYLIYDPTVAGAGKSNGFTFSQPVSLPSLKLTTLTSQNCLGTDESGNLEAGACGGGGGAPSGAAGGDLAGSYPNPTVAGVHATGGTLDGVTIGATAAAAGTFTTLTATGLASSAGIATGYQGNAQLASGGSGGYSNFTFNGNNNDGYRLGFVAGAPSTGNQNLYLDVPTGGAFFYRIGDGSGSYSVDPLQLSAALAGFNVPVASPGYRETLTTPASSSAACTAGQFTDDANYHYVCVSTNTWRRVALSSF